MNVIKLNSAEYEVISYNRNTTFNGETINSNASCNIVGTNAGDVNVLATTPLTSIQILHDNNLIYNLQNINAQIDNINEYLTDDRVDISLNIAFDYSNT